MMARSCAVVLAVASMVACDSPESRPEDVLKAFLQEVSFGRAEPAWSRLSERTRRLLVERHEARKKAAGEAPTEPRPAELLFSDLGLTVLNPAESVVVVSPPGDVVTLRVSVEGGESAEVRMVKEDGAWRVDLAPWISRPRESG